MAPVPPRAGSPHWLWCGTPLAAALVEMPWLFSLQPEYRRRSSAPDFTRLDAWLFDALGIAPVAIGFAVACWLLLRRRPRSRALLALVIAGAAGCGLLLATLLPFAAGTA